MRLPGVRAPPWLICPRVHEGHTDIPAIGAPYEHRSAGAERNEPLSRGGKRPTFGAARARHAPRSPNAHAQPEPHPSRRLSPTVPGAPALAPSRPIGIRAVTSPHATHSSVATSAARPGGFRLAGGRFLLGRSLAEGLRRTRRSLRPPHALPPGGASAGRRRPLALAAPPPLRAVSSGGHRRGVRQPPAAAQRAGPAGR